MKNERVISLAQGNIDGKGMYSGFQEEMGASISLNSEVSVFGIISEERPTITLTYQ